MFFAGAFYAMEMSPGLKPADAPAGFSPGLIGMPGITGTRKKYTRTAAPLENIARRRHTGFLHGRPPSRKNLAFLGNYAYDMCNLIHSYTGRGQPFIRRPVSEPIMLKAEEKP